MRSTKILVILVLTACLATISKAVPMGTAFTYQGRLMDTDEPADGIYEFEFKLYDSLTNGNQLNGTVAFRGVDVIDGYFTVELDFGSGVFDGDARWLEIGVRPSGTTDAFSTLNPRQEVTPTPYALYTKTAGGVTVPLVLSGSVASPGAVISGTNSGTGYGLYGESADTSDVINYGGYFVARGRYGRAVYGKGTGDSGRGVWGETDGQYGIGVQGTASGENSYAVYGYASNNGDVTNYGGRFVAAGLEGRAVYGEATATSGKNYGGYFLAQGPYGQGVHGEATGEGGIGVRGETTGAHSWAVHGLHSPTGNTGTLGRSLCGVYGHSTDGWAVHGSSNNGYAGYFMGDVYVNGNLSKATGGFKIDHPLEPENKYLQHSFVESPDMMNVYNGNVLLDAKGEAVVELPEYFEALNCDFRYQLTCIGGFAPVYIAEKISGNRFKIAGGKKGMEVSWQVTGVRQDAYARANRIVVEEDKTTEERGYYLHPTAYGLPEEKGIETVHNIGHSKTRQVAKKADPY